MHISSVNSSETKAVGGASSCHISDISHPSTPHNPSFLSFKHRLIREKIKAKNSGVYLSKHAHLRRTCQTSSTIFRMVIQNKFLGMKWS